MVDQTRLTADNGTARHRVWCRAFACKAGHTERKGAEISHHPAHLHWPTPDDVKGTIRLYRTICLVVGLAATAAFINHEHALGAVFAAVAVAFAILWAGCWFFTAGYNQATSHIQLDHAADARPQLDEQPVAAVRPAQADLESWLRLPPASDERGYLYVLLFETGVVKVGQTNNPARRVKEHRSHAFCYNVVITDAWISREHEGYLANEVKLIRFAHSHAGKWRREYFHDADFSLIADYARSLTE